MMVTVRVADFGRAAPPSRGERCFSARRRRKFCEGRGQNGHFPLEKTGGVKNSTEELHPATRDEAAESEKTFCSNWPHPSSETVTRTVEIFVDALIGDVQYSM